MVPCSLQECCGGMDGGARSRGGARKVTRTGEGSESIRVEEGGKWKGKEKENKRRKKEEKEKEKRRKKQEKNKEKGNLDILQPQSNRCSCFAKRFAKRLQLHLRSRSTRGAGALPNRPWILPLARKNVLKRRTRCCLFCYEFFRRPLFVQS